MEDNPTRIVILLPNMNAGGAERLVLEEVSFMKNDPRFLIEVHLLFEPGTMYDSLVKNGIRVQVWNARHKSPLALVKIWSLCRYLKRNNIDIVHSHLLDHVGPYIARAAGAKAVATVHLDGDFSRLLKGGLRKCHLVFGCGSKVVSNIARFLSLERCVLLNNAVRPKGRALPGSRKIYDDLRLPPEAKIVLSLGRLTPQKGYDVLIPAFKKVVQVIPDAFLVICGDGAHMDSLQNLVTRLEIEKNVRLAGFRDDVDEVLSACHLYVNSSRNEGLPMSILEALAHGKPVVATTVGGNSEVVHDNRNGLLVPPEDPELLAGAIAKLLTDPELASSYGQNSLHIYRSEYTISKHCELLARNYLHLSDHT